MVEVGPEPEINLQLALQRCQHGVVNLAHLLAAIADEVMVMRVAVQLVLDAPMPEIGPGDKGQVREQVETAVHGRLVEIRVALPHACKNIFRGEMAVAVCDDSQDALPLGCQAVAGAPQGSYELKMFRHAKTLEKKGLVLIATSCNNKSKRPRASSFVRWRSIRNLLSCGRMASMRAKTHVRAQAQALPDNTVRGLGGIRRGLKRYLMREWRTVLFYWGIPGLRTGPSCNRAARTRAPAEPAVAAIQAGDIGTAEIVIASGHSGPALWTQQDWNVPDTGFGPDECKLKGGDPGYLWVAIREQRPGAIVLR